ncbi:hypothetical protein [Lignipirellula cremea]|uniref:hypothetical protein n=1 Tax=Lignipirellula cremea TaxID=2528010 RepID=UPI0011A92233|nr:hypothetical protein [Lignipirellula cremea]
MTHQTPLIAKVWLAPLSVDHIWPGPQDDMQMVAHHGKAEHLDAELAGQKLHPPLNPRPPMVKILARHRILATKERPPHTAIDAMEHANRRLINHFTTRSTGHDGTPQN